jgi:general secretion pathway protein A
MYERFYGLRELPFELTPNPKFLLYTAQHREALSNLQYGLATAKPLVVLIAEAGMGKTTLLRTALESEACQNVHAVHLSNPTLTRGDFTRTLAAHFGLGAQAADSKAVLLQELDHLVRERRARGEVTALIVDEAQSLSTALFEEIRLLANIESSTEKLLPLVLAGQPELGARLEDPTLRQLKQRIALRCEIAPLSANETAAYIANRIKVAGGNAFRLFTREAVAVIYQYSRGIPRVINVICDNSLVGGMAHGRQPVDQEIVLEVCRDFSLHHSRAPRERSVAVPPNREAESVPVTEPDAAGEQSESAGAAVRRFLLFDRKRS